MCNTDEAVDDAKENEDCEPGGEKKCPPPPPPPEIEIVDKKTGKIVSGTTDTKLVGQKIHLLVRSKPAGHTLKNIQWTIASKIVKTYTDGNTTASVADVPAADLKKDEIEFHWVDGGSKNIQVGCDVDGTSKSDSVTHDVKAPTLDKFNAATDVVALIPTAAAPTHMSFGKTKAGIKWDWKVTVPGEMDGQVKDVQTIEDVTKRTKIDGTKQVWTISGTKVPPTHVQLDTTNPYSLPGDFSPIGFPKTVTAGGSFNDNFTSDSPRTPLGGTKQKFVEDIFEYFIMYKPDEADAIWVPVAKAGWKWKAEAKLNTGTGAWDLVSNSGSVTAAGAATTKFPEYKSNVSNNTWQDE